MASPLGAQDLSMGTSFPPWPQVDAVLPISRVSSTVFLPGGWLANWFGVTVFQMVRPFCGNQLLWGRTVVEPWAETLTVANCISFAGMTQWGGFGKVAKLISVGNLGWAKLRQRKNLGIDSVLRNNLSHLLEDLYFLPETNPVPCLHRPLSCSQPVSSETDDSKKQMKSESGTPFSKNRLNVRRAVCMYIIM